MSTNIEEITLTPEEIRQAIQKLNESEDSVAPIKLYLDEHIDIRLAKALQRLDLSKRTIIGAYNE